MADTDKKRRGKWTEESMKMAIDVVITQKMTARQAAESFSVPRSTLGDRLREIRLGNLVDLTPQMGRFKKTFDDEMENQLVKRKSEREKKKAKMSGASDEKKEDELNKRRKR